MSPSKEELDNVMREVNEALEIISNKYFVSTWVIGMSVRSDDGTHSLFTYDGSHPEALGLAHLCIRDLSERGDFEERGSNDPE